MVISVITVAEHIVMTIIVIVIAIVFCYCYGYRTCYHGLMVIIILVIVLMIFLTLHGTPKHVLVPTAAKEDSSPSKLPKHSVAHSLAAPLRPRRAANPKYPDLPQKPFN